MALAMKSGLDPALAYKVLTDGAGNSRMFQVSAPIDGKGPTIRRSAGAQRPIVRRIEPLRVDIRTGGPPLPIAPLTARFDTVPLTVAPVTSTEPDPVVALSMTGGLVTATSMALEPVVTAHCRSGLPSTVIRPLRLAAVTAPRTPRS